jgi:deazaflavin-dependent oxidoreductase (nitroreductase family)
VSRSRTEFVAQMSSRASHSRNGGISLSISLVTPWATEMVRGWRSPAISSTSLVPLQYFPDGQDLVVVAANGGMPSHPGWYFNLKARPEAEVEIFAGVRDSGRRLPGDGEKTVVRARELPAGEAAAFWPQVLQVAPQYARYWERTCRVIPLMRLVPVPGDAPPKAT